MKYVIEHLEPRLFKWCIIEYSHISRIVGKDNLIITNLNKNQAEKLKSIAACYTKKAEELNLERACVLDPAAEKALSPEDANKFDYLVFGGILGDFPPRERTKEELKLKNADRRNIGKEQFPTDNAVMVCKKIIKGTPIGKLEFTENIDIELREGESVEFPFKYLVIDGKPFVSKELIDHLKKRNRF